MTGLNLGVLDVLDERIGRGRSLLLHLWAGYAIGQLRRYGRHGGHPSPFVKYMRTIWRVEFTWEMGEDPVRYRPKLRCGCM